MVQRIRTFISGLAAVTGLLAWIVAGIIAGHTTFYWTRVEKAEGIVTALSEVPCSVFRQDPCFDPEVVFVTADRGPITFKGSASGRVIAIEEQSTSLVLTVGQSIPVLYDAKQPNRARIASSALLWGLPSKLLLGGAILILIAFLFRPGRPLAELGILRDRFGR
jgi:hypothetical protein